jgi:uncharacterized protein (TIGR02996 family)
MRRVGVRPDAAQNRSPWEDAGDPLGPRAQALITAFLRGSNSPPSGWDHIRLNDPDQSTARLVMADAYQESGRERDADLLRDIGRPLLTVVDGR